jgi:hypothetical protein
MVNTLGPFVNVGWHRPWDADQGQGRADVSTLEEFDDSIL